uniref:FCP1 homology domain-containing protein n=1 Tax=Eutreptiella gymnastica TaxID=73025 RepID=A0A7S4FUB0_9EUGL
MPIDPKTQRRANTSMGCPERRTASRAAGSLWTTHASDNGNRVAPSYETSSPLDCVLARTPGPLDTLARMTTMNTAKFRKGHKEHHRCRSLSPYRNTRHIPHSKRSHSLDPRQSVGHSPACGPDPRPSHINGHNHNPSAGHDRKPLGHYPLVNHLRSTTTEQSCCAGRVPNNTTQQHEGTTFTNTNMSPCWSPSTPAVDTAPVPPQPLHLSSPERPDGARPTKRVCLQLLFRELTTAKWDSRLQRGFQLPNPLVIRYVKDFGHELCPEAKIIGQLHLPPDCETDPLISRLFFTPPFTLGACVYLPDNNVLWLRRLPHEPCVRVLYAVNQQRPPSVNLVFDLDDTLVVLNRNQIPVDLEDITFYTVRGSKLRVWGEKVTPRPGLLPFLELAAPFFDRLCIRTLSVNPRASAVIYCLDPQLQNLLKNALPKTGLPSWLQEWKAAQQRIRDCAESLFKLSGEQLEGREEVCELKRLEDKLVELLKPSLFTGDGPKLLSDCNMQSSRPYRTLIIDDQPQVWILPRDRCRVVHVSAQGPEMAGGDGGELGLQLLLKWLELVRKPATPTETPPPAQPAPVPIANVSEEVLMNTRVPLKVG